MFTLTRLLEYTVRRRMTINSWIVDYRQFFSVIFYCEFVEKIYFTTCPFDCAKYNLNLRERCFSLDLQVVYRVVIQLLLILKGESFYVFFYRLKQRKKFYFQKFVNFKYFLYCFCLLCKNIYFYLNLF